MHIILAPASLGPMLHMAPPPPAALGWVLPEAQVLGWALCAPNLVLGGEGDRGSRSMDQPSSVIQPVGPDEYDIPALNYTLKCDWIEKALH